MTRVRPWVAFALVVVALVLQVSLLDRLSWHGVVPNLVLLVVVAAGLTLPAQQTLVLGFAAGLLLDLAPPADHYAGRWALAMTLVAFLVARVRPDVRPTALSVVATVAAASFVGSSVFALGSLTFSSPGWSFVDVLQVVLVGVVWDVILTPVVLPALMALFARLDPRVAVV